MGKIGRYVSMGSDPKLLAAFALIIGEVELPDNEKAAAYQEAEAVLQAAVDQAVMHPQYVDFDLWSPHQETPTKSHLASELNTPTPSQICRDEKDELKPLARDGLLP